MKQRERLELASRDADRAATRIVRMMGSEVNDESPDDSQRPTKRVGVVSSDLCGVRRLGTTIVKHEAREQKFLRILIGVDASSGPATECYYALDYASN